MDLSHTQAVVSSPTFIDSPLSSLSRDRRGLLPLKKRRLHLGHGNSGLGAARTRSTYSTVDRSPRLDFRQASSNSTDNKVAALALMGSSSASFGTSAPPSLAHIVSSSSTTLDTCTTATSDASIISSASCLRGQGTAASAALATTSTTGDISSSRKFSEEDSLEELSFLDERMHEGKTLPYDASASSDATTMHRGSSPALSAPLPGGCHGRTSRNNSYCRRLPVYNGSQYCKLHYQQFVLNASAGDDESGAKAEDDTASEASDADAAVKATGTPASSHPASRAPNQQDRRFTTSDPPDARCQATTTRGRPCAFVSVIGRKYCHLHATYGTDPPPRRSGYTDGAVAAASSRNRSHGVGKGSHSSSNSSSNSSSRAETLKKSKSRKDNPASHTSAISGGPGPLLSSTPSNQWSNKLVQIATGPFKGENGTVLKWGNGWVTLRLLKSGKVSGEATPSRRSSKDKDQGVLHNRRAVELYLLS